MGSPASMNVVHICLLKYLITPKDYHFCQKKDITCNWIVSEKTGKQ